MNSHQQPISPAPEVKSWYLTAGKTPHLVKNNHTQAQRPRGRPALRSEPRHSGGKQGCAAPAPATCSCSLAGLY